MVRIVVSVFALTLALGACGQPADTPATPTTPAQDPAPAPAPTPPAAEPAPVIPAAFLGRFDTDGGECGQSDRENPLRLEAKEIIFYESGGDVTAVRPKGADTIEVDAAMSGEGEEWTATLTFALSDGGATLTTTQTGVAPTVRHRCTQPEGRA